MDSNERQGRQPGSGLRGGVAVWALGTLASAVGGALGGATLEPLSFLGFLFWYGVMLGAAQAFVLWRYPLWGGSAAGTAGYWLLASFAGWIASWMIALVVGYALAGVADLTGVPGIAQRISSAVARLVGEAGARTTFPADSLHWALFAACQIAIAMLVLAVGRRALLPLAALWVLAGAVGGALGVVASMYIMGPFGLRSGGPDLFSSTGSCPRPQRRPPQGRSTAPRPAWCSR